MIAVARVRGAFNLPCIIRVTERRGLKVVSTTWCGEEFSAGDGVEQLPVHAPLCVNCKLSIDHAYPSPQPRA